MIEQPIVLILGAGASWDYGFPTGTKLKAKIWDVLFDHEFPCMSTLDRHGLTKFRSSLELTPDLSIDAFPREKQRGTEKQRRETKGYGEKQRGTVPFLGKSLLLAS